MVGIGKRERPEVGASYSEAWRTFLRSTWPLLAVVFSVVVLKINMILSLIGVIALFAAVRRVGPNGDNGRMRCGALPPGTFSALAGVMVFKHVMEMQGQ